MAREQLLGVVLAGGGSRRMGFDKTALELDGRSVVLRAADLLRVACTEVVVSSRPGSHWEDGDLRAVPDLRANLGPLAGLEAVLEAASGRSVFLLACDLPQVSAELVDYIRRASERATECAAVVPAIGGRVQPLCGIYRQSALEMVRDHLNAGRRAMLDLLDVLDVTTVVIDSSLPFFQTDLFHNLNRPKDLEQLTPDHPHRAAAAAVGATARFVITAYDEGDGEVEREDQLAVEEPLEIRLITEAGGARTDHRLSITMRSPGHDPELACGFLLAEGIIASSRDVWRVGRCETADEESAGNVIEVHLAPAVPFDAEKFRRNVYTSSSCGICGRESIESLKALGGRAPEGAFTVAAASIRRMPALLRESQGAFSTTGGLHACGLFSASGELELVREDVGRHNAVDKVAGRLLLDGRLPASAHALLVSGRASFELVHKTMRAGVTTLLAVGAPSSLAVEAARAFDMTLVGFLRDERFNTYSGGRRIRPSA